MKPLDWTSLLCAIAGLLVGLHTYSTFPFWAGMNLWCSGANATFVYVGWQQSRREKYENKNPV